MKLEVEFLEFGLQHMESCVRLMTSLQTKELHLDDVCRILALDTFSNRHVSAVMIFKLNTNATCSIVASFGLSDQLKLDRQNIPLAHNLPSTVAIRMNDSIWIPTQLAIDEQFQDLAKFTDTPKYNSLYALPIRKFGAPVGSVVILGDRLTMDGGIKKYLELLGLMLASRFLSTDQYIDRLPTKKSDGKLDQKLTKREELIQVGMAKGFTNAQIAIELGYSESTIRQSAVELFSKLGVTNRVDAGKLLENI